jgi:hypothetical protein
MEKMIAYCGLVCSDCPAYIATQKNDDEERKKVAEKWNKEFNGSFKPEDVNCDGCPTESDRLIGFTQQCQVRKCAKEKVVINCAHCDDYGCEKLIEFFKMAPLAKENLEEIRKNL